MAIFGFVLFFFITGLIFAIVFLILKRKADRCSEQTQGKLVEILRGDVDSGGSTYIFTYNVNGMEYRLKSMSAPKWSSEVGDEVTIWYNPAKPEDAQAVKYSNKVYKVLIIIGVVMLLMAVLPLILGIIVWQIQTG